MLGFGIKINNNRVKLEGRGGEGDMEIYKCNDPISNYRQD